MALKKLNQFNYFDAEGFFSKLKLITVGSTVWKEYGSNVVKGTKLEVVIASDKHRYNMALRRFRFLWHFCPCDIISSVVAPILANYRKQEAHLYLARRKKEDMKVIGEVVKEGRPTAERTVREWQESHPTGKKADCIRETGLAKHTVYKWWKDINNENI